MGRILNIAASELTQKGSLYSIMLSVHLVNGFQQIS